MLCGLEIRWYAEQQQFIDYKIGEQCLPIRRYRFGMRGRGEQL